MALTIIEFMLSRVKKCFPTGELRIKDMLLA